MSGFEVYKLYLALKLHFTTDTYNYFTFNGKSRASLQSFEKRKDRYFFKKLATKFDNEELIQYFVSHFVANENTWIGNISVITDSKVFSDWKRKIQSMRHIFEQDVDTLLKENKFENVFKVVSTHPPLITKYLSSSVTLETLVILNQLVRYVKDFDKTITEPLVWPELKRKVVKYEPFLSIDKPKYKKILLSKIQ
jgi:T4 gene Gp59 loader of gp41 DNA helicase/T4 gene Gp59 loader of gp41 DNA helicase C-term